MRLVWWGLLLSAVIFVAIMAVRDITSASGPDYCQLANLRTCKVGDSGTWVMVTTPDGSTNLVLLKNGKVVQVLH